MRLTLLPALLVLLASSAGPQTVRGGDSFEDRLVQLRTVGEGVATICEKMEDTTLDIADTAVAVPYVGLGIRMTLSVLGVPDKVDRLRTLVEEQNQAVLSAIGNMKGDLVNVSNVLDKTLEAVKDTRRSVDRQHEEGLFTSILAFQKTLADDPPRTLDDLRAYQKEFRRYVNTADAMLALRPRELPFAIALNTAGISLSQLYKLDLTQGTNRFKAIDSNFYASVSRDVRLLLKRNAELSNDLDLNVAREKYTRCSDEIKSYARTHGLQPVVTASKGSPIRFVLSGEEKYLKQTDVEYSILRFSKVETPIYDHRHFAQTISLQKPCLKTVTGVPVYLRIDSEDVDTSSRSTENPDGTPAPVYFVGKLEESSDDYIKSTLAKYNELVTAAESATTHYILLLSLAEWEKTCQKSLESLENSVAKAVASSRGSSRNP